MEGRLNLPMGLKFESVVSQGPGCWWGSESPAVRMGVNLSVGNRVGPSPVGTDRERPMLVSGSWREPRGSPALCR